MGECKSAEKDKSKDKSDEPFCKKMMAMMDKKECPEGEECPKKEMPEMCKGLEKDACMKKMMAKCKETKTEVGCEKEMEEKKGDKSKDDKKDSDEDAKKMA